MQSSHKNTESFFWFSQILISWLVTFSESCIRSYLVAECDEVPTMEHGTIIQEGNTYGMIITYSCNEGYELVGEPIRVCRSDRKWSGGAPTCQLEGAKWWRRICIFKFCVIRGKRCFVTKAQMSWHTYPAFKEICPISSSTKLLNEKFSSSKTSHLLKLFHIFPLQKA